MNLKTREIDGESSLRKRISSVPGGSCPSDGSLTVHLLSDCFLVALFGFPEEAAFRDTFGIGYEVFEAILFFC